MQSKSLAHMMKLLNMLCLIAVLTGESAGAKQKCFLQHFYQVHAWIMCTRSDNMEMLPMSEHNIALDCLR